MESEIQLSKGLLIEKGSMLSDAHCHLDLFENPGHAVKKAIEDGVGIMVTAGTDMKSSMRVLELARGPNVYGVIGIGPDAASSDYKAVDGIEALLKSNKNIIGIGEVGLDRKIAENVDMKVQTKVFERQVEIAASLDVPLVIHSRMAIDDVIGIISEHAVKKAVFHFFEGSEEHAKKVEKMGYLISIPPIESGRMKRIIKDVDIDIIVSETDSPVVGKSPAAVKYVVEKIAELKGMTFNDAGERITETIKDYFYI